MNNEEPMELVRLECNLNVPTAEALQDIQKRKNVTLTEAIRRSIAIYYFIIGEVAAGRKIETCNSDGSKRRDLVID